MVISSTGMASGWRKKHFFQNHEAGSVMIWGGISSERLTELAFLDGWNNNRLHMVPKKYKISETWILSTKTS